MKESSFLQTVSVLLIIVDYYYFFNSYSYTCDVLYLQNGDAGYSIM